MLQVQLLQIDKEHLLGEQESPKLKKKVSEEPPIDADFDFVNFPNLSVDEQLASIPKQFLQDIEFEKHTHAPSHHTCVVVKHPDNHSGSWACDKVQGASYCLSGITGFYQSKGIAGWRCA